MASTLSPLRRAPADARVRRRGRSIRERSYHNVARILFSEGSSLTAREFLSVLGPAGHHIELIDPDAACICRFSRWTKRVHRCPPAGMDPLGYLKVVSDLLASGKFDILLPTHEQEWLFAVGRSRLGRGVRVAIASADAFFRVQSKIEFARLLDEVSLPLPEWQVVAAPEELAAWSTPFYLKTSFSTAGTGVRKITNSFDGIRTWESLRVVGGGGPVMVQAAADGEYAQVYELDAPVFVRTVPWLSCSGLPPTLGHEGRCSVSFFG